MGFKLWCCAVLLASYSISFLIDCGFFMVVYNHAPGKCTRFNMSGSEDLALYPNNHVLISSGLYFPDVMIEKPGPSGIFLLDLNAKEPEPINLPLEGFSDPADLNPHGMSKWISKDGSMYLYVINHRKEGDTVESFEYKPLKKKLTHRKTFRDPLFSNLNSMIAVELDKFYVTMDRYFHHPILKHLETYSRLALAYILYYDGAKAVVASDSLKYPNGITKSNDGRFIFVNELLRGQVVAYTRNEDHTLTRVQVLQLEIALDNINIDPKTGNLIVAIFVHPLKIAEYFKYRRVAVPSRCLHVKIDQNAELPFDNYLVEEVFSSTGEDGMVGAVTGCIYANGKLVVGTIAKDMMVCDAPYLMYN